MFGRKLWVAFFEAVRVATYVSFDHELSLKYLLNPSFVNNCKKIEKKIIFFLLNYFLTLVLLRGWCYQNCYPLIQRCPTHLNVANGFHSKYLKNRKYLTLLTLFCSKKNFKGLNRDGTGYLLSIRLVSILMYFTLCAALIYIKSDFMWKKIYSGK